ncbi:MAG: excinuclease ABC subunit UvrC [Acutalibacteraceae bacterium]|nr:excinuclease ABC subunit UvrC [Acutalibacteraceae bacterium]
MNRYADPEKLRELKNKANRLPLQAGVYIMKNKDGEIIYIGKAKALKNRVTQYFGSGNQHTEKVRRMVSNVDNFEYIICDSEFEALILENSLIKQNQPKYNILLKDDKGYFYIKITDEKWKRIETAKSTDGKGEFIGPYNSGYIVKETVDEARKIFKLPDCNRNFDTVTRPCLNYHIGLCDAPCRGKLSLNDYLENINSARDFIKHGDTEGLSIEALTEKMNTAAENLQFETAAKLRDRINAIKKIREKQKVVSISYKSQDIIATAFIGETACVEVLVFRNYRLSDKKHYFVNGFTDKTAVYNEFLQQYYLESLDIPSRIVIDTDANELNIIERWLTEKSGKKTEFINPKQGEQLKLLNMCLNNAAENLSEKTERTGREMSALNELGSLLGLNFTPRYIESYDISNTAGSENVAGMIVFTDGRPDKTRYKRFKIKGFIGQDDYRSMAEVLDRRFSEYEKGEDEGFSTLPDLILLDGAKGQINAVLPVMKKYNLDIPIFGMVKDSKHRTRAIATTGGDIAIKSNKRAFKLVTDIQDEVHRFAIGYHKKLQSKTMIKSELLDIEGVGKTRAAALIKHFGSIKKIKEADITELSAVKGMTKASARAVFDYFH